MKNDFQYNPATYFLIFQKSVALTSENPQPVEEVIVATRAQEQTGERTSELTSEQTNMADNANDENGNTELEQHSESELESSGEMEQPVEELIEAKVAVKATGELPSRFLTDEQIDEVEETIVAKEAFEQEAHWRRMAIRRHYHYETEHDDDNENKESATAPVIPVVYHLPMVSCGGHFVWTRFDSRLYVFTKSSSV